MNKVRLKFIEGLCYRMKKMISKNKRWMTFQYNSINRVWGNKNMKDSTSEDEGKVYLPKLKINNCGG